MNNKLGLTVIIFGIMKVESLYIVMVIIKITSIVDIVVVTTINFSIKNFFRKQDLLKRYSIVIKLYSLVVISKSIKPYFFSINSNSLVTVINT